MTTLQGIALAAVAFAAWLLAAILARSKAASFLADHPNERSLHDTPTPRVGGLAVVAAALPAAAWLVPMPWIALLGIAGVLALLSALDDVRSLPIKVRLTAHFAAAALAVLALAPPAGIEPGPGWVEGIVAVLAVAWMTNLYNFMDGADGLAGGMAVAGFGALAIAALGAGEEAPAWIAATLVAACAGFLVHNFPPARLFLGDAGSIPLGFLAGALALAGVVRGTWPAWFPVLVFSPFIVDASATLVRRLLRGERVWKAHREHAYQRLVLAGWGRRRLAFAAYALMAAAAASALLALRLGSEGRYAIISVWAALYALLVVSVERLPSPSDGPGRRTPAGGFGPEEK